MGKINLGRVIVGGIVAGIVADILGFLVDGVWLAPQWADGMKALGRSEFTVNQMVGFNLLGIATGIFALWVYAAIRPRYGAGPRTAVYAGLAAWVASALFPNVAFMGITGFFPLNLTLLTTLGGIVEWVVGALAGAALYQEASGTSQTMAARA